MNQSRQLISPSLQRTNLPHKEANDRTLIRTTLRQSTTAHPTTWSLTVIRQTSLAYTVRCHGLKQGTGKILHIRWTDTSGRSGYSTNRTNPLFERWESRIECILLALTNRKFASYILASLPKLPGARLFGWRLISVTKGRALCYEPTTPTNRQPWVNCISGDCITSNSWIVCLYPTNRALGHWPPLAYSMTKYSVLSVSITSNNFTEKKERKVWPIRGYTYTGNIEVMHEHSSMLAL